MSVTFFCPEAPRDQVPCPYCEEAKEDGRETPNRNGGYCDSFCQGFEEVSVAPEVNLSNANASAVLNLLGFEGEDLEYGSCDAAVLRQRIFRARNTDRSALVQEASVTPGGHAGVQVIEVDGISTIQRMGPTIIIGPNTDQDTLGRLGRLDYLARWAQDNNMEVVWG